MNTLAQPAMLDLYHRTSAENAAKIYATGSMLSREASGDAFFSTIAQSEHTTGYGDALVHVRVPRDWIEKQLVILEDEFELDDAPDGSKRYEDHYVLKASLIRPEHLVLD